MLYSDFLLKPFEIIALSIFSKCFISGLVKLKLKRIEFKGVLKGGEF